MDPQAFERLLTDVDAELETLRKDEERRKRLADLQEQRAALLERAHEFRRLNAPDRAQAIEKFLLEVAAEIEAIEEKPPPPPAAPPEPPVPAVDPAERIRRRWPFLPPHALPLVTDFAALEEESDLGIPFLSDLPVWQRSAQIGIWAGRGRGLQERLQAELPQPPGDLAASFRQFFGKLTTATKNVPCAWIEALHSAWKTDWGIYVRFHRRWMEAMLGVDERTARLTEEEEILLAKDRLRAVIAGPYPSREAKERVYEAAEILPEEDPLLREAGSIAGVWIRGPTQTHCVAKPVADDEETTARPARPVRPEVLAITRGKRGVIIGGNLREPSRLRIKDRFELATLEWIEVERGRIASLSRVDASARSGGLDLAIFLTAFQSHKTTPLVKTCRAAGVRVVFVPRGYGVTVIEEEIARQLAQTAAATVGGRNLEK